ncbi:hypothetical protein GQ54DRAFT_306269 [Martensiomyces pterosporus]|nr:hypothetical protein GQ54DRAFT_306269 [Martensiomyces pterosporus]
MTSLLASPLVGALRHLGCTSSSPGYSSSNPVLLNVLIFLISWAQWPIAIIARLTPLIVACDLTTTQPKQQTSAEAGGKPQRAAMKVSLAKRSKESGKAPACFSLSLSLAFANSPLRTARLYSFEFSHSNRSDTAQATIADSDLQPGIPASTTGDNDDNGSSRSSCCSADLLDSGTGGCTPPRTPPTLPTSFLLGGTAHCTYCNSDSDTMSNGVSAANPAGGSSGFLGIQPYIKPGSSLWDQIIFPHDKTQSVKRGVTEHHLAAILRYLGVECLLEKVDGDWGRVLDWSKALSAEELYSLAICRLVYHSPRFAFVDDALNSLTPDQVRQLFNAARQHQITLLVMSENDPFEASLGSAANGDGYLASIGEFTRVLRLSVKDPSKWSFCSFGYNAQRPAFSIDEPPTWLWSGVSLSVRESKLQRRASTLSQCSTTERRWLMTPESTPGGAGTVSRRQSRAVSPSLTTRSSVSDLSPSRGELIATRTRMLTIDNAFSKSSAFSPAVPRTDVPNGSASSGRDETPSSSHSLASTSSVPLPPPPPQTSTSAVATAVQQVQPQPSLAQTALDEDNHGVGSAAKQATNTHSTDTDEELRKNDAAIAGTADSALAPAIESIEEEGGSEERLPEAPLLPIPEISTVDTPSNKAPLQDAPSQLAPASAANQPAKNPYARSRTYQRSTTSRSTGAAHRYSALKAGENGTSDKVHTQLPNGASAAPGKADRPVSRPFSRHGDSPDLSTLDDAPGMFSAFAGSIAGSSTPSYPLAAEASSSSSSNASPRMYSRNAAPAKTQAGSVASSPSRIPRPPYAQRGAPSRSMQDSTVPSSESPVSSLMGALSTPSVFVATATAAAAVHGRQSKTSVDKQATPAPSIDEFTSALSNL